MGGADVLLLNLINIALGIAVLICLVGVIGMVSYEAATRWVRRPKPSVEPGRDLPRLGARFDRVCPSRARLG